MSASNLIDPKSNFDANKSESIFEYAMKLMTEYIDWDKSSLINPENYTEEDRDNTEKVNAIFQSD